MEEVLKQFGLALSGIVGSGAALAVLKTVIEAFGKGRDAKGEKVKAWRGLLTGNQWQSATPALLEATFADIHGFPLGDREIRFGLSRHNSTEFFRRLGHCRAMVEANGTADGMHHRRGLKLARWNYRTHGIVAAVAGLVPLLALAPLAQPLSHVLPGPVIGWLFVYAGVWFFLMCLAAQQYEAAHVITDCPDRFFPRWARRGRHAGAGPTWQ